MSSLPSLPSPLRLGFLLLSLLLVTARSHPDSEAETVLSEDDPVALSTREYWMRRAIDALYETSPCPFAAFGSVIVNHTAAGDEGLGELICTGVNRIREDGNPTLHGEISAINNCTSILTDPEGPYALSGPDALKAMGDLSLYTTAEACAMCTSAILYGGFREYIYSTSIPTLRDHEWPRIEIRSTEVFARSKGRDSANRTRIVSGILADETEPLFVWQYAGGACPKGCAREEGDDGQGGMGWCVAATKDEGKKIPDREL